MMQLARQRRTGFPGPIRSCLVSLILLLVFGAATAAAQQLEPLQGNSGAQDQSQGNTESDDAYNPAWFVLDGDLNPGLEPPDELIDRTTPQSSVSEFLRLGDIGNFRYAAHLLDLSLIPVKEQAHRGPVLAEKLYEVMARMVTVDWAALPDRPDAIDTSAARNAPRAGQPRKSIRIAYLNAGPRPVSIRINRIKPGEYQPIWLFSAQTVTAIPRLYARFGPSRIERQLPAWLTRKVIGRYGWWEVLMTPAIIAVACLLAWGAYRLIDRLNRPLGWQWVHTAIQRSRAPAALIVALTFFYSMMAFLGVLSGPIYNFLQPVVVALLIGGWTWLGLRIVDTALDIATNRYVGELSREENSYSRHLYTNISVLRRVILLVAVLAAAGLLVEQLHTFESLGNALLASAGIITIVLGFAAQTVLGNILSSIQIAIAKPIRIGDTILYEGKWGYVEEINYTYVLIRIWNDRRLVVPVRYFISHPFENWSLRDTRVTMPVELTLDHRTDVQAMREKFAELLEADERRDPDQEPKTLVISQDEDGMVVRFYAGARQSGDAWALQCDLREQLLAYARELDNERYLPHTRLALTRQSAAE